MTCGGSCGGDRGVAPVDDGFVMLMMMTMDGR